MVGEGAKQLSKHWRRCKTLTEEVEKWVGGGFDGAWEEGRENMIYFDDRGGGGCRASLRLEKEH